MKESRSDRRLPLPKWPFGRAKTLEEEDEIRPASLRSMMRYATRSDWILLWVGVACSAANGAIGSAILMMYARIVDAIVKGQTQFDDGDLDSAGFKRELLTCSAYYFVAVGVILLLGFPSVACLHIACERQIKRIRRKYLQQVLNQDITWLDRNEVGCLTQTMNAGVERMQSGTGKTLSLIIYAVSGCATGIIIWRVSLVMLIFLPFLFISIYGSGKAVKTMLRKEAKYYGRASAVAEEVLSGIRTVMSCNAQPVELERYGGHVKSGYKNGVRKVVWTAGFAAMYNFFIFGSMGVLFWYGSTLSLEAGSGVTVGIVQGIFWLFALGAIRLGQAAPHFSSLMGARMAAAEMFAVIDRLPDLDCASVNGEKPASVEGTIEFSDVHFRYPLRPEVPILNGVSFSVQKGETVALVGHSGCGKSTLFSLLLRFYDQERGTITIDGRPLDSLNVEWLRQTIGVVSQESVVFAGTVAENIRLGREDLSQAEMEAVCRQANADEFIRKLPDGYNTRIGEGHIRLSGGQRQRLSIARVLGGRNPRILLLDEATSALDTESERLVQAAIEKASSGRSTLIIAHRLSTVRNADRIVCFDQGRIVESGSHEELMAAKGNYFKLVIAQELATAVQMEDVVLAEGEDSTSVRADVISKQGSLMSRSGVRRTLELHSMHSARSSLGAIQFELEATPPEAVAPQSKVEAASVWSILRFAAPEKHLVILGFVLTLLRGVAWPTYTLLLGRLYRDMSHLDDLGHDYLARQNALTGLLFGALAVVSSLLTVASGIMLGTTGERITRRLRMGNFLSQDASFFDRPTSAVGVLSAHLSSNAPCVQAAIDQRLADVMQASTSFVIGIVAGLLLDYRVAAVAIAAVSLMLGVQLLILNVLKRRTIANARSEEEAARIANEAIENVRVVQALTQQRTLFERFSTALELPYRQTIRSGLYHAISFSLSCCAEEWNFAVIYGVAAFLITNGQVEPIRAFQCVSVINAGIIMTFLPAASYIPEFVRAKVAAGLMIRLLDEPTKIGGTSDSGKKIELHGDVAINHAYFSYPNHKQLVLKDFSVKAFRGQTLALVGPSGSGKSTTIQLLERFYDVLAGSVKIDDVDIREFSVRHLRSQIALVEQEATLFNLTIRQNIAYGLKDVCDRRIEEAARLANIHSFVESLPLKYDTIVGGRGKQLSGGQKQRICIARAVILLLDEATSALDQGSEKVVQEALEKASEGRTCITIAHRLSTIQHADVIAVVKDGRVVEQGTHSQLLSRKGLYYRLANRPGQHHE